MNLWEILQSADGMSIELVVWSIFIGISAACLLAIYDKRYMGNFVRKILDMKANTPESAKTLTELGYKKNFLVKNSLQGKTDFSGLIYESNEKFDINEEGHAVPAIRRKVNFENARFYIPEQLKDRAYIRYDKKGTHIMSFVLALIGFAILAALAVKYIPELLKAFNNK